MNIYDLLVRICPICGELYQGDLEWNSPECYKKLTKNKKEIGK